MYKVRGRESTSALGSSESRRNRIQSNSSISQKFMYGLAKLGNYMDLVVLVVKMLNRALKTPLASLRDFFYWMFYSTL